MIIYDRNGKATDSIDRAAVYLAHVNPIAFGRDITAEDRARDCLESCIDNLLGCDADSVSTAGFMVQKWEDYGDVTVELYFDAQIVVNRWFSERN